MAKKIKHREILRKYLQQLVENGVWQLVARYHYKQTSKAKQIRLVDRSINALKFFSILPHINTYEYL